MRKGLQKLTPRPQAAVKKSGHGARISAVRLDCETRGGPCLHSALEVDRVESSMAEHFGRMGGAMTGATHHDELAILGKTRAPIDELTEWQMPSLRSMTRLPLGILAYVDENRSTLLESPRFVRANGWWLAIDGKGSHTIASLCLPVRSRGVWLSES